MKRNQRDLILDLLRERGREGITDLDVFLTERPIRRLSARIYDLRQQGYDITSTTYETPSGARVARYVLHEVGSSVTTGTQLDWWTTT